MVWLWLALAWAAMPLSGTGICTYEALVVASSQRSVAEVREVGDALRETYGVSPRVLRTPTATELWSAVRALRRLPRCAAVIVYVAARNPPHGWDDGQWRLSDASGGYTEVPLRSFVEAVRTLPADHVWLVADAAVPEHWFAPTTEVLDAPATVQDARTRVRKRGRWLLSSGAASGDPSSSAFAAAFVQTVAGGTGRYHTPASVAETLQLALAIDGTPSARVGQLWDQASVGGELVLVDQRTEPPPGVRPRGAREQTSSGLDLRWVPAATVSSWPEEHRRPPLPTIDGVWVTKGAVTRVEWERVMSDAREWPFPDCGSGCAATGVSWFDAVRFANATSAAEGLESAYDIDADGRVRWVAGRCGYRLLTAAERNALLSGTSPRDVRRDAGRVGSDAPLRPQRCGERGPYRLCRGMDQVAEWLWTEVPGGRLMSRGLGYEPSDPVRVTERSGTRLARPAEHTCGG